MKYELREDWHNTMPGYPGLDFRVEMDPDETMTPEREAVVNVAARQAAEAWNRVFNLRLWWSGPVH